MTRAMANLNQVGFFYESGLYATPTGLTLQSFGLVQNHAPDENITRIPTRYLGGASRNVGQFVTTTKDYTGTITYFPQDWKMLMFALGSVAETVAVGSHVLSEPSSGGNPWTSGTKQPFMSFTIEDAQRVISPTGLNIVRTLNGGMVDTYNINITKGEIVSCELGYIAQSEAFSSGLTATGAPTVVVIASTVPYVYDNVKFHLPSGTTFDNTNSVVWGISNNIDPDRCLNGSKTIGTPFPQNRDYEITVNMNADAARTKTIYTTYFEGGSTFNCMVQAEGKAGSLYLVMSGCSIMDMDAPSPIEGINEQTWTIQPTTTSAVSHDSIVDYSAW